MWVGRWVEKRGGLRKDRRRSCDPKIDKEGGSEWGKRVGGLKEMDKDWWEYRQ